MRHIHKLWRKNEHLFWWSSIGFLALFGQFGRVITPLGAVSWYEIVLASWTLRALYSIGLTKFIQDLKSTQLGKALVFWVLWIIATLALNASVGAQSEVFWYGSAYLGRMLLYIAAAWSFSQIPWSTYQRTWLRSGITCWFLMMTSLGIAQYLVWPDTRLLFWMGWDNHLDRAVGTLLDPGFFGIVAVLGSSWAYIQWRHAQHSNSLLTILTASVSFVAVVLSTSRASYLAWVVSVSVLAWYQRSWKTLVLIGLLPLTLLLLPRDGGGEGQKLLRTASIEARGEFTQTQVQQLKPWQYVVGSGWYSLVALQSPGEYGTSHATTADSTWLHVFVSTGGVGMFLWLWVLWEWWRARQKSLLWIVWLAAILSHGVFAPTLWYPWVMLCLVWES